MKEFCKEWSDHRRWLLSHRVSLEGFAEERRFQEALRIFNLKEKAQSQRMMKKQIKIADKVKQKADENLIQKKTKDNPLLKIFKRKLNAKIIKLDAITEVEEVKEIEESQQDEESFNDFNELQMVKQRSSFMGSRPKVTNLEASVLGKKSKTDRDLGRLVKDVKINFNLEFMLSSEDEDSEGVELAAIEILGQQEQARKAKKAIKSKVRFHQGQGLDSLLQVLFDATAFRKKVLQQKDYFEARGKTAPIPLALHKIFERANEFEKNPRYKGLCPKVNCLPLLQALKKGFQVSNDPLQIFKVLIFNIDQFKPHPGQESFSVAALSATAHQLFVNLNVQGYGSVDTAMNSFLRDDGKLQNTPEVLMLVLQGEVSSYFKITKELTVPNRAEYGLVGALVAPDYDEDQTSHALLNLPLGQWASTATGKLKVMSHLQVQAMAPRLQIIIYQQQE